MGNQLIILRGLPGAGKSTFAKLLLATQKFRHYEADMYFEEFNNNIFDAKLLPKAHAWCKEMVQIALAGGYNVIVSNTFTQEWEMKPYIDFCLDHGFTFSSVIIENRHGNESIHGVPLDTMQKMRQRFQVKL